MSNTKPTTGFHTNPERINKKGRSKGLSLTEMVREALEEVDEASGKTWKRLIVEKIISKAVNDGDTTTINRIWAYIDGQPKQGIEVKNEKDSESLGLSWF